MKQIMKIRVMMVGLLVVLAVVLYSCGGGGGSFWGVGVARRGSEVEKAALLGRHDADRPLHTIDQNDLAKVPLRQTTHPHYQVLGELGHVQELAG